MYKIALNCPKPLLTYATSKNCKMRLFEKFSNTVMLPTCVTPPHLSTFFVWIECVKKNMASPQFLLFSKPNQNLVLIFAFHALVFKFPTYHAVMCMVGTENRRKSVTKFMQKKLEKFEEKVCYDAWWHQKEEEERVIRRRDPNICLVYW